MIDIHAMLARFTVNLVDGGNIVILCPYYSSCGLFDRIITSRLMLQFVIFFLNSSVDLLDRLCRPSSAD